MRTTEPLLKLPAFCGVGRTEGKLLLRHTELVRLWTGQSLLPTHRASEELLIVVQGRLQALGSSTWTAGPGDIVGAHELLTRRPQPISFRTTEPSLIAYAGIHQTRTMMCASPAFATAVAVALSAELDRRVASSLKR